MAHSRCGRRSAPQILKTREWASPTRVTMIVMASDIEGSGRPTAPADHDGETDGAEAGRPAAGHDAPNAGTTCVFCRIVSGGDRAHLVFSDDVAVAFLDRVPLFPGHTLIVPRAHVDTLTDLPAPLVGPYFARVQRLATVVESTMDAAGTFVAMNNRVSQSVPHLHTHVVPRRPKDGLRGFFWPRTRYDGDDQAADVAQRLADAWGAAQQHDGLPGLRASGE